MRGIAIFAALVLIPSSARAEEQVVRLKQAPGLDAVEGQCGACHSLDYIVTNSPFLDAGKVGCGSRQNDQGVRRAD